MGQAHRGCGAEIAQRPSNKRLQIIKAPARDPRAQPESVVRVSDGVGDCRVGPIQERTRAFARVVTEQLDPEARSLIARLAELAAVGCGLGMGYLCKKPSRAPMT
jgi:hypothetical protein